MKPVILGFDTSCYTTSAAAVTMNEEIVCSSRKLLPVPEGKRGLRQSEMVFIHTRQLNDRVSEIKAAIGENPVAAVCASAKPRDDEDSYMPAFQVGLTHAKSIAAFLNVPFFETTHQRGHLEAAKWQSGLVDNEFLAVHLSGGTTELLKYSHDELALIGGTNDLHAGQVVDRIGVALGLPFPAGPSLEKLAVSGKAEAIVPTSFEKDKLHCHLSGGESMLQRLISGDTISRENIAAEVYDFLARTVAKMVTEGNRQSGIKNVLLFGGVASSALFRRELEKRVHQYDRSTKVYWGRPEYSGDNAVGAALIGAKKLSIL